MKFTLKEILDTEFWTVGIGSRFVENTSSVNCEFWVHPSYQDNPGMHVATRCNGSLDPFADFSAEAGDTYIIQSWWDGTSYTCRLLSEDRTLLQTRGIPGCTDSNGVDRALTIRDDNVNVDIDYVHVFEMQ
jgi:hypothetical protein